MFTTLLSLTVPSMLSLHSYSEAGRKSGSLLTIRSSGLQFSLHVNAMYLSMMISDVAVIGPLRLKGYVESSTIGPTTSLETTSSESVDDESTSSPESVFYSS